MLLDQRRLNVLQLVEKAGFISLQELVDRVGVSESTVRRDLEFLDGIGQIRRTRGGAAFVGESLSGLEERSSQHRVEKRAVAALAASLIQSGEVVLLDGGTTTLEVARRLGGRPLQVVTNSLPIINVLMNQPQIELISIGGYVYPKTGVALGPIAVAALKQIHVRRLVMSVGGITEAGLFNSNLLLVETERQMIASAEEVIVVTDSSKFGHPALAHLCPLTAVQHVVVDAGLDPAWREVLEKSGIQVHLAPAGLGETSGDGAVPQSGAPV